MATEAMATSRRLKRRSSRTSARDTGPDLAEDEDELHLAVTVPARLPRLAEEPVARGLHQRVPAPASGEGAPACARDPLHLVHGRALVLPVPRAEAHRDAPDVLLPPF